MRARDSLATTLGALEGALEPFVVGLVLGSFVFHWRSGPPEHPPVRRVVLAALDSTDERDALDRAVAVAGAGWRSRMLATVPSNVKNPGWLAEQAEQIAAEAGLDVRVWTRCSSPSRGSVASSASARLGHAAAADPPRLHTGQGRTLHAHRRPGRQGHHFRLRGISIKPAESMASMKRDMTGGGVVLSTMAALAAVGCPVRVVGLVPAAENAVSGSALRPGDVVRHYGGRTSEVTNTDAEGRLVLADALAYAVAELAPAAVVDVATLTGGIKVALGQSVGGLFATDDALAAMLLDAGTGAGEPLWRMPLHDAYADKLASKVGDADNGAKGPAAIMAALFLRHFVGDVPWAHLDVASVGDVPCDRHEWTEGPSGFGARVLLEWLGSPDPLAGVGA